MEFAKKLTEGGAAYKSALRQLYIQLSRGMVYDVCMVFVDDRRFPQGAHGKPTAMGPFGNFPERGG